jgi:hypothetical protein
VVERTRRGLAILAAIAGAIGTPGLPDDGQFHPYFLVFTIPGSVAAALAAANAEAASPRLRFWSWQRPLSRYRRS